MEEATHSSFYGNTIDSKRSDHESTLVSILEDLNPNMLYVRHSHTNILLKLPSNIFQCYSSNIES